MYSPSAFTIAEAGVIRSFVQRHSFGLLLSLNGEEIKDTHTPMFLSEDGKYLFGHIARANDQWKSWAISPGIRAIFHGPHCYISPRFYQGTFNVPTWNYTAVSIVGKISLVDSLPEQKEIIRHLIASYEAGAEQPWQLDESDEKMMKLFEAIVCFRIEIETIEAKFKLNQNKSPEDQASVIAHLRARGTQDDLAVAALMAKNLGA